jgi:hypothetical protein
MSHATSRKLRYSVKHFALFCSSHLSRNQSLFYGSLNTVFCKFHTTTMLRCNNIMTTLLKFLSFKFNIIIIHKQLSFGFIADVIVLLKIYLH